MTNGLPVQRINIPSVEAGIGNAAADIVIRKLREIGMDPGRALLSPMARQLCQEWSQGRMTDVGFVRSCENLLIFNPTLKL